MSDKGERLVSAFDMPPRSDRLAPGTIDLLDRTLSAWSRTARASGIQPWLVYMPTKRRVLDGRLRFTENALPETVQWRPTTGLPDLVKSLCEKNMISYIDVTPALVSEVEAGRLTHNPIFDSHLNRLGADVVARVIAGELKSFQE